MGRRRKSGVLTVALNGRVIGRLPRAADGATRFDYAQEWLDWDYAIPVSRSMPLVDRPFTPQRVPACDGDRRQAKLQGDRNFAAPF